MEQLNKKQLIEKYRKCKSHTYALKLALPKDMSLETAKLFLKVLDDVDSAVERLEGDLYISEKDPDFEVLKGVYSSLFEIKSTIEQRFDC